MTFGRKTQGSAIGQSRGKGEFIDNINWWFWNGKKYPGLLTRDQFSMIANEFLTDEERIELSRLLVNDMIVSLSKERQREARLTSLLNKISDKLESVEGGDRKSTLTEFNEDPLNALKAYINVLEFWNYEYSWVPTTDVWNKSAIIVMLKGQPVASVHNDDIQFVQGRPFHFTVSFKGLTWHFEQNHALIRVLHREYKDGVQRVVERWLT